jgi:hypothetical protein
MIDLPDTSNGYLTVLTVSSDRVMHLSQRAGTGQPAWFDAAEVKSSCSNSRFCLQVFTFMYSCDRISTKRFTTICCLHLSYLAPWYSCLFRQNIRFVLDGSMRTITVMFTEIGSVIHILVHQVINLKDLLDTSKVFFT